MDLEDLRNYCLSKAGTTESFPFDKDTMVFKVLSKLFAIIPLERDPLQINLKCDPERAEVLRDGHPDAIFPGYHMNKKHWNTVFIYNGLTNNLLKEMVDHSYDLVRNKLTKKEKTILDNLAND